MRGLGAVPRGEWGPCWGSLDAMDGVPRGPAGALPEVCDLLSPWGLGEPRGCPGVLGTP